MIIFFHVGRLGNQIFEYSFLNSIKKDGEVIVTSKCPYFEVFDHNPKEYIFLNRFVRIIFRRVIKLFCILRLINYVRQDQVNESDGVTDLDTYSIRKGLFKNVRLVEGFFQAASFINSKPKLKPSIIDEAKTYLNMIPTGYQKVFIHIRRGDYLDWSVLGKSNPTLPHSFSVKSISEFKRQIDNPFFIFLTDDPSFVEKEFKHIENKVISDNSVGVDLAIMSLCNYGQTSNSTLSWWGAYLMDKPYKVISPKYWLGWQSNKWFPYGIKYDQFEYKDVSSCVGS